ncbi:hypothetical protein AB1Y20_016420 [Prymnesium parvum]|uniref:EGF-like domain-containing protein n=1 Tax=Prymnesium parvum TaxID=97485 RepID=A0AB34ICT8_PRYPA
MACSGVGTLDESTGRCSCPLTSAGPRCDLPLLPACAHPSGPLRPFFWLHAFTQLSPRLPPLPCDCLRQLLALTALQRSKWTRLPAAFPCADTPLPLAAFLDAPSAALASLRASFDPRAREYSFSLRRGGGGAPPPPLLPARGCAPRCAAGWCVNGSCVCFPEAVATRAGSCRRVAFASPRGLRARGAEAALPLHPPSSAAAFNAAPCPLDCSSRGECDLHGFCRCEKGFWGLDCGLTAAGGGGGGAVAWRHPPAATAPPAPRIYVYDLAVRWRLGAQLLAELDGALLGALLASPHREANAAKADYFWVPGPNLLPARKLRHLRAAYPYWNRSGARPSHILTLFGERGAADSDLPSAAADAELHAGSPSRRWLSLTLNGMADGGGGRRCHVCFAAGVDVVVPPPAASVDVPSCAARAALRAPPPPSPRPTTLFWAGRVVRGAHAANPAYASAANVREAVMAHAAAEGFRLVDSARGGPKLTAAECAAEMARASFCWVPPGQRYGDARRHLVAAMVGCVPVFSVPDGHHTLEELLPWRALALHAPREEQLAALPALLRAVEPASLPRRRRALACAAPLLWYARLFGRCGGAEGAPDGFDGLMAVLAARLRRQGDEMNATRATRRWLSECLAAAAAAAD